MRRMAEEQNRTLVLCSSCKKKRCPVISLEPDGSFVLSDVDQSTPGRVVLTREQGEMVFAWLQAWLGETLRAQNPGFEGEDAVDRTFRQGNL
jgi:hypothetical protein